MTAKFEEAKMHLTGLHALNEEEKTAAIARWGAAFREAMQMCHEEITRVFHGTSAK